MVLQRSGRSGGRWCSLTRDNSADAAEAEKAKKASRQAIERSLKQQIEREVQEQDKIRNAPEGLCARCRIFDLKHLFRRYKSPSGYERIWLGYLDDIRGKSFCPFCRMMAHVVDLNSKYGGVDFYKESSNPFLYMDTEQFLSTVSDQHGRGVMRLRVHADMVERTAFRIQLLGKPLHVRKLELEREDRDLFTGRLTNKSEADYAMLRSWIDLCESNHGETCLSIANQIETSPVLRVVDVHDRKIVEAPPNCRYAALSYVWGQIPLQALTRDNHAVLCQAGGLSTIETQLPNTARDALYLADKLGFRYLWIDSLCIIQDDPNDRIAQIGYMDRVYGHAAVTIVAAAGDNANAGLPGVGPDSRVLAQHVETLEFGSIVPSFPPPEQAIHQSAWNSRGWTFQEGFVSSRCIIATRFQMYFTCKRETWCEDTHLEARLLSSDLHQYRPNGTFGLHGHLRDGRTDGVSDMGNYIDLVKDYSSRRFTFEPDIFDAFIGMSNILQSIFSGGTVFYGIPETIFDAALLWSPASHLPLQRRTACRKVKSGDQWREVPFPSWSWMGWVGQVKHMGVLNRLDQCQVSPEIDWFIITDLNGAPVRVNNAQITPVTASDSYTSKYLHDPVLVTRWKEEPHNDRTFNHSTFQIPPGYQSAILRFWTSSAVFPFSEVACKSNPNREPYIFDRGWSESYTQDQCEFIVIARCDVHKLGVMLIEWQDGIAYRLALGTIKETSWVENNNRQWKLIYLG